MLAVIDDEHATSAVELEVAAAMHVSVAAYCRLDPAIFILTPESRHPGRQPAEPPEPEIIAS